HHLRCGDSLFGLWVRNGIDKAAALGAPLLLREPIARAWGAASAMHAIDELADAGIAGEHRLADTFAKAQEMTAPLDALLSLLHPFDWLDAGKNDKAALRAFADGQFGDPVRLALGTAEVTNSRNKAARFAALLRKARQLIADERFFNWEVVFPDVWSRPVGW